METTGRLNLMFTTFNKYIVFPTLSLIILICAASIVNLSTDLNAQEEIEIYTIEDLNAVRDNLTTSYILMNDLDFEDPASWEDYETNYDTVMNVIPAGTVIENEYLGKASLTSYNVDYPPIGSISSITVNYNNTTLQPFELGITAGWEITDEISGEISFFDIDGNSKSPEDILELPWLNWYSVRITYSLGEKIHWGWEPIGDEVTLNEFNGTLEGNGFTGNFNGNGFEIKNLYIHGYKIFSSSPKDLALFTYLQGGKIDNIKLINADIQSTNKPVNPRVATLVVYNSGTIDNSFSSGNVSGRSHVGGLVAYSLSGDIKNSSSRCDVYGMSSIGGLAGKIKNSAISHSFSSGEITCEGGCGGLVGNMNSSTVTNSYAIGNVAGENSLGGLVGSNYEGMITNSYAMGDINATQNQIGGLVGINRLSTITDSYATGNVSGNNYVGGLVGRETSSFPEPATIYTSYATGNVMGNQYVGGFSGSNEGTILNSYSTGHVTGETDYTGAFSGYNKGSITNSYTTGSVYYTDPPHPTDKGFVGREFLGEEHEDRNNFFDSEVSNQLTTTGNATAKNTEEMKSLTTFTTIVHDQLDDPWDIVEAFDFTTSNPSIWYIDNLQEYPKHSWQYVSPQVLTSSVSDIHTDSVKLKGSLTNLGTVGTTQVYFQYREIGGEWINTPKTTKSSLGNFNHTLINLDPNTTYEYQAVVEFGNSNYEYGSVKSFQTDKVVLPKVIITDIGLIDNIIERDSLLYYFTSTIPRIQGRAYPNSYIKFESEGAVFTTRTNRYGEFAIQLEVPRGSNEIQYYGYNNFGSQSAIRELTLVVGTEYFPEWLLEKLGLVDTPEEEQEDDNSQGDENIEKDNKQEEQDNQDNKIPPPTINTQKIKFTDKKGNPLTQATVEIEGNSYMTNSEGEIEIENLENRKYVAEVKTKDGKIHSTDILGIGDRQEIIIEIDDNTGTNWNNIIIYSGIGLLLIIVILFTFAKRKQTQENY